jgi:hypothetical protein
VCLGNVVDELLNQHGLSDTGTTEETNLSTTSIRSEEIDDLDTGLENLSGRGLVNESGRVGVNGAKLDTLDRATLINGLANNVHNTAESSSSDGNLDGSTSVDDLLATNETLCTVHGNGTDSVLTQVGGDLENETATGEVLDLQGIQDRGQALTVKLNIDDGTNDGLDGARGGGCLSRICAS